MDTIFKISASIFFISLLLLPVCFVLMIWVEGDSYELVIKALKSDLVVCLVSFIGTRVSIEK